MTPTNDLIVVTNSNMKKFLLLKEDDVGKTKTTSSSTLSTMLEADDNDDDDRDDDNKSISISKLEEQGESSYSSFFLSTGNYDSNQIMNYSVHMIDDRIRESYILNQVKEQKMNPDNEVVDSVPTVEEQDILIGRMLGHGGFCYVHEVNFKTRQQRASKSNSQDPFPYAVKRLIPKIYDDASDWIQSIYDFYMEIQYLSVLNHPHIVSVVATSSSSCITNPCPFHEDVNHLFVVFDKLDHTLSYRMNKVWKNDTHHYPRKNQKVLNKMFDIGGKKETQCFLQRLKYAYDIGQAIQYLHERRMIYRDIKPDNIGFDSNNVIKMFDFGLMREYNPAHCTTKVDGISYYPYTAQTGSFVYMDPYVATGMPYNELCDVYSFCILLSQMIELEVPYNGYSMSTMQRKVWISNGGNRPNLDAKHWSPSLKRMITDGWSYDYSKRPNMKSICDTLHEILNESSNKNSHSSIRTKSKSEGVASFGNMNGNNDYKQQNATKSNDLFRQRRSFRSSTKQSIELLRE